MKRCCVCKETKPTAEFYPNRAIKDGFGTDCKKCRIAGETIRAKRAKERIAEYKRKPCMDCGGIFPPVCMDFDHRDPTTKSFELGQYHGNSWSRLLEEMAKCDLVCANCHRIRSQKQRASGMFKRNKYAS